MSSAATAADGAPERGPDLVQQERGRAAARSTAALLVSRAVVSLLGWAGSVVIARVLSPQDWGHWSFVFGLLGLLAVVTDLGVGRVVVARLVQDDDPVDGRRWPPPSSRCAPSSASSATWSPSATCCSSRTLPRWCARPRWRDWSWSWRHRATP